MSAGVLSIDTSLRIYGGDFDLVKSTSSGRPIPRPRQYGLVRCPGSAGALAGMGQWSGWWAGADLWSAGIPRRHGDTETAIAEVPEKRAKMRVNQIGSVAALSCWVLLTVRSGCYATTSDLPPC